MKPTEAGGRALIDELAAMRPEALVRLMRSLPREAVRSFDEEWRWRAFRGQLEPAGAWRIWLLMAGRGFGKTRAGAEWVLARVREHPGASIALVGGNLGEVARVMLRGPTGILSVAAFDERPVWRPNDRTLTFPNGAQAFAYSAERPESLRGPQHDFAWCDELAKWGHADATWDNLMLGLRAGERPRALVTTTPRAVGLLRRIRAMEGVAETRGRTWDNVTLVTAVLAGFDGLYGGTRLGRQELEGELIDDVEGALWTRAMIEKARVMIPARPAAGEGYHPEGGGGVLSPPRQLPLHHAPPLDAACGAAQDRHGLPPPRSRWGGAYSRVVIGVDPPASAGGDACGIIACGLDADGVGYVLGDHSVRGRSPEGWARAVAAAAEIWSADKVVVEANQGGEMVESVLRGADVALPVKSVHARYGKGQRAEPVATWFEKGKAKFLGAFPELEDELAGLTVGGGYEGPGRSPDRADAMVWAMTELLGGKERPMPRIRRL
jgi:phage terminase large subunit-like protein